MFHWFFSLWFSKCFIGCLLGCCLLFLFSCAFFLGFCLGFSMFLFLECSLFVLFWSKVFLGFPCFSLVFQVFLGFTMCFFFLVFSRFVLRLVQCFFLWCSLIVLGCSRVFPSQGFSFVSCWIDGGKRRRKLWVCLSLCQPHIGLQSAPARFHLVANHHVGAKMLPHGWNLKKNAQVKEFSSRRSSAMAI